MMITLPAAPQRATGLAAVLVAFLITQGGLAADERQACYDAYEHAQVKKKEGDPRKARDLSRLCAREACPSFVRADCVTWMEEAEKAIPTVVLQAQTDEGDATHARVLLDGAELTTNLDGRSLEVDPGPHVFRFELAGAHREVQALVKEGEKSRPIVADFRSPRREAAVARAPAERPTPSSVWIAGGIGAAGLVGFGALAIAGSVAKGSLQTECAPFCTDAQTSPSRSLFLAADISLGVGLAGAATAVALYLLRPEVHAEGQQPRVAASARLVPVVAPSVQGASLVGAF